MRYLKKLWPIVAFLLATACQPTEVVTTVVVTEIVDRPFETVIEVPADDNTVTILGPWSGADRDAFTEVLLSFTNQTGIGVAYEETRDIDTALNPRIEAGYPPDIAILSNPDQMGYYADLGALKDMSVFIDVDIIQSNYPQTWIEQGTYNDTLYGIFYKATNDSLIWYSPQEFERYGYRIPQTWDDLMALTEEIANARRKPWCMGLESGGITGWPATNWIEDIVLRTSGPEVYDQWISHEISWTDPAIADAWARFGEIALNEDYVAGGVEGMLATNFGDAPAGLFEQSYLPSKCYMLYQGAFIREFFPQNLIAGQDYDFFPVPPINEEFGTPARGQADILVVLNDDEDTRALMNYLATVEAQQIWAARSNVWVWPNKHISPSTYPDPMQANIAATLVGADVFRYDASAQMPGEIGSAAFLTGIVNYLQGEELDSVLETIEAAYEE